MSYVNKAVEGMSITWRNRDLDKPLSPDQVEYFSKLAVQTPTKQSNKYFDVVSISNPDLIEKVYEHSAVPDPGLDGQPYNPQVLAPLLLLWMESDLETGEHSKNYIHNAIQEGVDDETIDRHQAVGISSGVVAYEANRLGFQTGFCRCLDDTPICKELQSSGLEIEQPVLLSLSIGHGRDSDPRQHQKYDWMTMEPHDKIEPNLFYIS